MHEGHTVMTLDVSDHGLWSLTLDLTLLTGHSEIHLRACSGMGRGQH